MTNGMMHLLAAAVISLCCVAGPARAEMLPDQLSGRWISEQWSLVLDISRCGGGWCGVRVKDGACADTALRLEVTKPSDKAVTVKGTLLQAVGSQPYLVGGSLSQRDGGALSLSLAGNTDERVVRRTFDFRAVFVRTRDASCVVDQKTS